MSLAALIAAVSEPMAVKSMSALFSGSGCVRTPFSTGFGRSPFPPRCLGLPCGSLGNSSQLQTVAARGQVRGVLQGRAARGLSFSAHGRSVDGRGRIVANNNNGVLI